VLALIGIVYGALVAMVQPNMKKLIAYSSISHLDLWCWDFQFHPSGIEWRDVCHAGPRSFLLARCSCWLESFTSVVTPMRFPNSAGWPRPCQSTRHFFCLFCSLRWAAAFERLHWRVPGAERGLPGKMWWGVVGTTGVIWSACYLLWMYQRVFFGKVTHAENSSLLDLNLRERVALWPAAIMALAWALLPCYG